MHTPLQKNENVLLVTYTSWISMIWPALFAIAAIIGSVYMGFIDHYGWAVALLGIVVFIVRYLQWKSSVWVVTNLRVIDEAGLLSHYAKESPLDKINNVSYDQTLWGRLFNYGHVEIQTAAEIGATDYFNVAHPKKLKDTITLAQSDFQHLQVGNQATQMASAMSLHTAGRPSLANELEKLFELKQKGVLSEEEYVRAKNKLIG
ncbi:MAG: PH domain-containing protein [Chitinophagaceae bacterium]